jgi:hypothetical protein
MTYRWTPASLNENEVAPMTNASRFLVVPLSEVPAPVATIKIGSLEAVLVNDRRSVRDALGPLKSGSISYEVQGLPNGQRAWILKDRDVHQVICQVHGESEWLGKFETPEDALKALASKLP